MKDYKNRAVHYRTANYKHAQKGFTLIELMIGITISLVVLAGASGLFVTTLTANSSKLITQRVDQAMRSLVGYMTTNIRMANYAGSGSTLTDTFSISADNRCITFSRAKAVTTVVGSVSTTTYPEVFYGFRFANNAVYVRKNDSTVTCNTSITTVGAWTMVTDPTSMNITEFTVSGTTNVAIHIKTEIVGKYLLDGTTPVTRVVDTQVQIRNI